jgi:acyl-CoA dehydrogenase family protein 9
MKQSFARAAFEGTLPQDVVFPYPRLRGEDEEILAMLLDSIRRYAALNIDDARIDAEGHMPREILSTLADLGIMGIVVPEEYGGAGMSVTAYCRVLEEISYHSGAVAVTVGAHQSIGMKAILLYGTDAQKRAVLPPLAAGREFAAFALTEPGAGSDAGSIQSTAVATPEGDAWILNGTKQWITNAGFADVFTVFARTDISGQLPAGRAISCFIVRADMPGVTVGPPEKKIGIRGSETNEVHFENVRVPAANLLGDVGAGFKIAMSVLNEGRLGLATGCVGAARKLIERSVEYANARRQFGQPIGEFEIVKEKLADMAARTYVMESAAYLTAGLADRGIKDISIEAAICKVMSSESLWFVVDQAIQIHGGNGFMEEYPFGRMMRDARINLIFEGTNEILRVFIAGMGVKGTGEELRLVAQALRHPRREFGVLSRYFSRRVERRFLRDRLRDVHPELDECARAIERVVQQLPVRVEALLRTHGRAFVQRQYLMKRIANVAIDTYGMVAATSRTDTLLKKGVAAESELVMTRYWCRKAARRIRRNLRGLLVHSDALTTEVADRTLTQPLWFHRP